MVAISCEYPVELLGGMLGYREEDKTGWGGRQLQGNTGPMVRGMATEAAVESYVPLPGLGALH